MEERIDYDAIARKTETRPDISIADLQRAVEGDDPAVHKTTGPVIIDGTNRIIRNAETGEPIASFAEETPDPEREVDLVMAVLAFWVLALVVIGVGIVLSTLTVSQKFVVIGGVLAIAIERLWIEIKRTIPATEPEGVIYASEQSYPDEWGGGDTGPGEVREGAPGTTSGRGAGIGRSGHA